MSQTAYQQDRWGYVYCLTNEGFPHLVKIGITTKLTPQERAKALTKTGTPYPFQVLFAKWVEYPYQTEQELHKTLKQANKHANKEYFHLTPREAVRYFEELEGEWDPAPQASLRPPTRRERQAQAQAPRREESQQARVHAPLIGSIQISIGGVEAMRTPLVTGDTRPSAPLQEVVVEPGAAPAPPAVRPDPPRATVNREAEQERFKRFLALLVVSVLFVIVVWYLLMG
jgi:hypothetical protein